MTLLDSTNAEALRRAAAGDVGPRWILARRQSAARGRRGRAWAMLPGNFAATLLARPPGPLALRSFVAALGLYDAMVAATGRPELFALKWPNDVLLSGGKLAGILLESGAAGTLAVGIGVNLAAAPAAETLEPGAVTPVSLKGATGHGGRAGGVPRAAGAGGPGLGEPLARRGLRAAARRLAGAG